MSRVCYNQVLPESVKILNVERMFRGRISSRGICVGWSALNAHQMRCSSNIERDSGETKANLKQNHADYALTLIISIVPVWKLIEFIFVLNEFQVSAPEIFN